MRRWLDPNWYRYLRYRLSPTATPVALVALALLAVGGALTMRALAGGKPAAAYVPLTTTVVRRVRVIEHGRPVYRRVREVKQIYARPVTTTATRTIDTPGGKQIVTEAVVRYRPVYRRQVVLVHGTPVTVARYVTNTRMLTDTQLLTLTNEHTSTVVNDHTVVDQQTVNQTVTNVRTQTLPAETVTVTGPTRTEVVTTTVESTVTIAPSTITVTLPSP